MLVLAGPGSGKTTVISERVRYLIEERGVEPGRILTITFTKAAAREMQQRCERICPRAGTAIFGTFHSVFYHFLHKSENYQNFTLMNQKEKKEIMKKIIPVGNMTTLQHAHVCDRMLKKISFYKNSAKIPEEEEQMFRQVMDRYCRLCKEQEKLDFDDMLVLCYELFTKNPEEAVKWQSRFQYILVDEFQDINRCQYEIVKLLAQMHGNIFVVGDDDQAIYSFRGSDPGYMKQFLVDFSQSRQVYLDENYRSGTDIVSLAGKIICRNENRFAKNIRAMGSFEHRINIKRYDSVTQETEAIAELITQMREGENKGSTAVLVRTNAQAEYVAEIFYPKKIPCTFRERRKCFYDNPWIQDILAVLRFAVCGQRRSDFLMFMNKPFRGLERAILTDEMVDLEKTAAREEAKGNILLAKELKSMDRHVKLMQGMDPYGAIKLVLGGMKYRTYLDDVSGSDEEIKAEIKKMTEELAKRARKFDNISQFLKFVKSYTENFIREETERLPESGKEEDRVHILTYHASKGLEFDNVFLPMLSDGIVPHGRMLTQQQTEEERRMFYVAMTRAKSCLSLSWHGKEDGSGASVFLKELDTDEIRA